MKIKIGLRKGQTPEEAEEELFKALSEQRSGNSHSEEFDDPIMEAIAQKIIEKHSQIWEASLEEINQLLDEEYE